MYAAVKIARNIDNNPVTVLLLNADKKRRLMKYRLPVINL